MSKKSWGVDWVMNQIEKSRSYSDRYRITKKNYVNEKQLYNCTSCKLVWEHWKGIIKSYEDFPKYKLEKKTCPKCK